MSRRLTGLFLAASLLAACGDPDADVTDQPPLEPTPYLVDDEGEDTVELDLDPLAAELERTLGELWSLNAGPVLDAYASVQAAQTETCPRTYSNDGNVYWFDQCTTDTGTSFSGYGFYYDYVDWPIGEQFTGRMRTLNGAARIDTPDGHALDVAGAAQLIEADHNAQPARLYQSVLRGTFSWDGPEAEGTWLEQDLAPDLQLTVFHRTDLDGAMYQLNGGVSGTGGASAYVFDQVTVIEGSLGGSCPREAHGVVSVRTENGTWIDLIFDGPDPQSFQGDPEACDGLGRAYYRGELLGEVEVDFTRLSFTGEAPW